MNLLEYCFEISREAYKQEEVSEKRLSEKVDYLFKWLTIIMSVFNIAVPLIVKTEIQQMGWFLPFYMILAFILAVILILTIAMQYPLKSKRYPLGSDVLQKVRENEKYSDEKYGIYQNMLYQDSLTKKLSENNSSIAKRLRWVCGLLIVSVIGISIFFSLIILSM